MKGLRKYLFIAITSVFIFPMLVTSCSDWNTPEPDVIFIPGVSEEYRANIREYLKSPHKVMFGWFGNWGGNVPSNSLMGLPDSIDFVGLWLVTGNLSEAQQADLKAFNETGRKTVMSWSPYNIGSGITPAGVSPEDFWGYTPEDEESMMEATRKYALALVDTCRKYDIGGFDVDSEGTGTLMHYNGPGRERINYFMRVLREEFDKDGRMLCIDIPSATGWKVFYTMYDDDVLESVDYVMWQSYEATTKTLERECEAIIKSTGVGENVLRKSIFCATFERAIDKHLFYDTHQYFEYSGGIPHAGIGAYHIEYDYPNDYPYVRAAISYMNSSKDNEEKNEKE